MSIKDESAYPYIGSVRVEFGLTKREKFAESAMIGILSNSYDMQINAVISRETGMTIKAIIAAQAVEQADALLAELEKAHG